MLPRSLHPSPRISPLRFCLVAFVGIAAATLAPAQQAAYPTPLLKAVHPPGGKAGTAVEVTLLGDDLDEATGLHFSNPGLKAERVPDPPVDPKAKNPPPPPTKFKVTIAADVPLGIHDLRVMGKWGISNPRAFAVGDLPEVQEKEGNDDVPQAQRIEVGTVASGVISKSTDVDYYVFAGKKGEGVILHCAASSVDSRLSTYLQLFSADARELGSSRFYRDGDALVSAKLPADGDYLVRISDFAYQTGGPESVYRLTVSNRPWIDAAYPPAVPVGKATEVTLFGRNLPNGQPAPGMPGREQLKVTVTAPAGATPFPGRLLPRVGTIEGFAYRLPGSNPILLALTAGPIVLDGAGNDTPETAQEVPFPSEICGRFEKRGDRDYYTFTAKKGDEIAIDGHADRVRAPMDLFFTLHNAENGQTIGEYDTNPRLPNNVDRFYTFSDDPLAAVTIPADGKYRLMVGSRDAGARTRARNVYWVSLREKAPDFRLILVGNHESGAGLTLRRGSSESVQVVCFRQDDFEGEILLTAEGLPAGVTCQPQSLGPKLQRGALSLTAAEGAKDWAGEFTITGTATVNGKKVTRTARAGCIVFPSANNQPAVSRLARSLCLAVRDPGPYRLTADTKPIAVPVGGTAVVKVKVDKQQKDFKDPVNVTLAAGPAQSNGNPVAFGAVNIAPDKEGDMKIVVPANAPAGTYNLVFRGNGKHVIDDKNTKKKRNTQYVAVSEPITLTVYDTAGELSLGQDRVALPAGSQFALPVKVKRLHGYDGEFTVEINPTSASGISAASVKIAGNASDGKLLITAAKGAKPVRDVSFVVRLTAKVGNATLRDEAKIAITIDDAAKPGMEPGKVKTVELLAEGAAGWRYAADVKGDDWRKTDFDDKAWKDGKAPLGNGEAEIATRKGTELAEKGQPLYFRHAFDVPADLLKQKDVTFRLKVASDDSAAVYLNGGVADEDTADHEFMYWNRDVVIPVALLKPGRNVVAVRVDNSAGSSDIYLDLTVVATVPLPDKK